MVETFDLVAHEVGHAGYIGLCAHDHEAVANLELEVTVGIQIHA